MGQSESKRQIEQEFEIYKVERDGNALLKNRKDGKQYLMRIISCGSPADINRLKTLLQVRATLKSQHLLSLVQIKQKQQNGVCSNHYRMYLLLEYSFKSLAQQMKQRAQPGGSPFQESDLWSILYSCCCALSTIYSNGTTHQCLSAQQLFVNRDGFVKMAQPLLFGLQKNHLQAMQNKQKQSIKVHLSPEIMNCLQDQNFFYYDKQKSDVFILGMIILDLALLSQHYLYDAKNKRPRLDTIQKLIQETSQHYSQSFADILKAMVHIQAKQRPNLSEIIQMVQKCNNLCDDYTVASQSNVRSRQVQAPQQTPRTVQQTKAKQAEIEHVENVNTIKKTQPAHPSHQSFSIRQQVVGINPHSFDGKVFVTSPHQSNPHNNSHLYQRDTRHKQQLNQTQINQLVYPQHHSNSQINQFVDSTPRGPRESRAQQRLSVSPGARVRQQAQVHQQILVNESRRQDLNPYSHVVINQSRRVDQNVQNQVYVNQIIRQEGHPQAQVVLNQVVRHQAHPRSQHQVVLNENLRQESYGHNVVLVSQSRRDQQIQGQVVINQTRRPQQQSHYRQDSVTGARVIRQDSRPQTQYQSPSKIQDHIIESYPQSQQQIIYSPFAPKRIEEFNYDQPVQHVVEQVTPLHAHRNNVVHRQFYQQSPQNAFVKINQTKEVATVKHIATSNVQQTITSNTQVAPAYIQQQAYHQNIPTNPQQVVPRNVHQALPQNVNQVVHQNLQHVPSHQQLIPQNIQQPTSSSNHQVIPPNVQHVGPNQTPLNIQRVVSTNVFQQIPLHVVQSRQNLQQRRFQKKSSAQQPLFTSDIPQIYNIIMQSKSGKKPMPLTQDYSTPVYQDPNQQPNLKKIIELKNAISFQGSLPQQIIGNSHNPNQNMNLPQAAETTSHFGQQTDLHNIQLTKRISRTQSEVHKQFHKEHFKQYANPQNNNIKQIAGSAANPSKFGQNIPLAYSQSGKGSRQMFVSAGFIAETPDNRNIAQSFTDYSYQSAANRPSNLPVRANSLQKQIKLDFVKEEIPDRGIYQGYKANNKRNGHGTLHFSDGGRYQGEWKDDMMQGFGKLYYQNGHIAYEGHWQNDQFNGQGRVYNSEPTQLNEDFNYKDFSQLLNSWVYYQGQFKNDSKHGKGYIKLTNGEMYEGIFQKDMIQGNGIFYRRNSQLVVGFWIDNKLFLNNSYDNEQK